MHEATTSSTATLATDPTLTPEPTVIHTPDGLPGFGTARRWSFERGADDAVFGLLNNLDQPGIGLMVTEPWDLAPGYEPDLPDDELARIGVRDARDITLLVVATIPSNGALDGSAEGQADGHADGVIWLNLAAPITVNARTNIARQVILDRQGWPLRHPVSTRS
jgi:flagellar assembly factor FliW